MSFKKRLIHRVAIVTPSRNTPEAVDDYGQPLEGDPSVDVVDGLIQPTRVREVPSISQAGVAVADHVVWLEITSNPVGASYIRFEPDDGDRYEVQGAPRTYRMGQTPHHEVDARRVVSEVLAVEAS